MSARVLRTMSSLPFLPYVLIGERYLAHVADCICEGLRALGRAA